MPQFLSELREDEKLETLRRLDHFRDWPSLDHERFCLVCERLITGRLVQVLNADGEIGSTRIACPTIDCTSIPMDWVLPTEKILAALSQRR